MPKKNLSRQPPPDRLVVRVRRRSEPDLRRLARALIDLALEELAAEQNASEQTKTEDAA